MTDTCYRIRVEELRSEAAFPVEALTLTLIVGRWLRTWKQDRAERELAGPPCETPRRDEAARVFDLDERDASYVVDRLRSSPPASSPPASSAVASRSAVRSG